MLRAALIRSSLLATSFLLVGCGLPPELADPPPATVRPSPPSPSQSPAIPTPEPPVLTTPPETTLTFSELTAEDCQGRPTARQVIDLLRRNRLLPQNVTVTVDSSPVCAGNWHYTVVQVPGHEPLQVVSEGAPATLRLVTAGTDVCSIQVRAAAPPGIRSLVC
ncbi:MAG TPA: hypothetical protein VFX60_05030 [Micromonospora sp.]|nr:hypothetical protein [Micromonospora sp.]